MAVATSSIASTSLPMAYSSLSSERVWSSGSASTCLPALPAGLKKPRNFTVIVRANADDGRDGLSAVVDKTKKEISKEEVLKNQEQNESEKRSVFGTVPSSGSFYPRPEIERRPETGDKSFGSLMAFDGAGPETINGRLAMVGIVWAFVNEMMTGQTVAEQLYTAGNPGLFHFLVQVQLFTYASLVPMFKGESPDSRSFGPFRAMAERWNGRTAMIGFLSLLVTEAFTKAPVFHM